jgi:hypothetical protein
MVGETSRLMGDNEKMVCVQDGTPDGAKFALSIHELSGVNVFGF